jgi:hypothetical protein
MNNYGWIKHAEEYLDIFPNIDFYKNHYQRFVPRKSVSVGFKYEPIPAEDGVLLDGYFQSEKNFSDGAFVRWLFTPSKELCEKMNRYKKMLMLGNTCSIHVRRGNYYNLQNHHPILSMDYYTKAMNTLAPFKVDKFFVFSNDMNWCKNNFIGDQFVFVQDVDYVELFLMASCTHHIVSNSSFGWWGAWLRELPDTVTIAPEVWFGNFLPEGYASDIIPQRWIKL